jgi:hypothetical protein
MGKQFDLEQQILDCWGITDDLDVVLEAICESDIKQDQLANIILGIRELYNLKFTRTFNTFESYIHEQYKRVPR